MNYYELKINGLIRKLPIIALTPKIKVATFNLLGDRKLVEEIAVQMYKKIKDLDFDYLVGPEVKVVPLLHELSKLLDKERYIICRKNIHGYMISPIKTKFSPGLVLDGSDLQFIGGKKVIVIDDVVSSGKTISALKELMELANAKIVYKLAIFKQGSKTDTPSDINFLYSLPVFSK